MLYECYACYVVVLPMILPISCFVSLNHLCTNRKVLKNEYYAFIIKVHHHHHHQPINVPTAGAQAFLMDYPQGERAITQHAGPVRIGGC
jgi:hypothetical protein